MTAQSPLQNSRAPGETGAEAAQEQLVAAADAAGEVGFVEGERNAAGRRVPVAVDVDQHLLRRDAETFRGGIENAAIGLMQNKQVDLMQIDFGMLQDVL